MRLPILVVMPLVLCLMEMARADEADAVKLVETIGAKIARDEKLPGNPVVMVSFVNTPLTNAVLARLKEFKHLATLNLSGTFVTDASLKQHIKPLGKLERLYLYQTDVTDAGVMELAGFDLTELSLGNTRITDKAISILNGFKRLRRLHLEGTVITSAGVQELMALEQLEVLNLSGCRKVALVELTGLKKLKRLARLDLGGVKITDAGMKELRELKELEVLTVGSFNLTDEGLKELKGLEKLASLDLSGCQHITGAGLNELKDLKHLASLDFNHATLTDADLKPLHDFKQLRTLNLINVGVSSSAVKALQEALPKCKIIRLREKRDKR